MNAIKNTIVNAMYALLLIIGFIVVLFSMALMGNPQDTNTFSNPSMTRIEEAPCTSPSC